jgi:hypothetical protein
MLSVKVGDTIKATIEGEDCIIEVTNVEVFSVHLSPEVIIKYDIISDNRKIMDCTNSLKSFVEQYS